MKLADIESWLDDATSRIVNDDGPVREAILRLKREAVASGDQTLAKHLWCLQTTLEVQSNYVSAVAKMKTGAFYEGWCQLEQVELGIGRLQRHFPLDRHHLDFIRGTTARFQSLFPYRVFMSPEIIKSKKECSICLQPVTIRRSCGHEVGEIYDGEMCHRIVSEAKFVGIAMVRTPVQKYSVPFLKRPDGESYDHYNYSVARYLVDRLQSPYDRWAVHWTTRRHPHVRFEDIKPSDPCPCERTQNTYADCCLPTEGVLRPHCEFMFENPPPPETLIIEYSD
jgi:hypothetical protein